MNIQSTEYIQINLNDIIKGIGEENAKTLLSSFYCPLNKDVENFIRYKAIEFSKRDFAKTHLVFWCTEDHSEIELVGYYTIAPKSFTISKDNVSRSQYKKISQYGEFDSLMKKCTISSILIGQLGKNFANGNDTLITGDELLKLALDKVSAIQNEIGGRYTYLECEDNTK
ncbi:MAG: N-acetyltransferase, partial [Pseudomonadota bacterium]|nr:N-acetyltransferase [Pseudomonadota bacterium]